MMSGGGVSVCESIQEGSCASGLSRSDAGEQMLEIGCSGGCAWKIADVNGDVKVSEKCG